jgi:hypothetical protein
MAGHNLSRSDVLVHAFCFAILDVAGSPLCLTVMLTGMTTSRHQMVMKVNSFTPAAATAGRNPDSKCKSVISCAKCVSA